MPQLGRRDGHRLPGFKGFRSTLSPSVYKRGWEGGLEPLLRFLVKQIGGWDGCRRGIRERKGTFEGDDDFGSACWAGFYTCGMSGEHAGVAGGCLQ